MSQFQSSNVKYLAAARTHDTLDMLSPVLANLRQAEEGFIAYDQHLNKMVFVQAVLHCCTGDNPMEDALAMITGSSSCRECDGNLASSMVGKQRLESETIATYNSAKNEHEIMSKYGVAKHATPLFVVLSVRFHKDLAVDFLHLFSLGLEKRIVAETAASLNSKPLQDAFIKLVNAFDFESAGLQRYSGVRVLKYHGSFQGHDFKAVAQFLPFVLLELVEQHVEPAHQATATALLQAMIKLSKVGARLWRVSMQRDKIPALRQEVIDTVESLYDLNPGYRKTQKAHMAVHIVDSIEYLGTPRSLCTEMTEAENKNIRKHIVARSNHHNPSRDLAAYYGIKLSYDLMLGGALWSPSGERIGYGTALRAFLDDNRDALRTTTPAAAAAQANVNKPGRPRYKIDHGGYRAIIAQNGDKVHLGQAFVCNQAPYILKQVGDMGVKAVKLVKQNTHALTNLPLYQIDTNEVTMSLASVERFTSVVKYNNGPRNDDRQLYFLNIFYFDHYLPR